MFEIIRDRSGIYDTADTVGEKIAEEVRHLGNGLMRIWASEKESAGIEEIKRISENMIGHGKKKCHGIRHSERVFLKNGHLFRPFSEYCGVRCRGYSLPLQRRITDFGADVPFGKVSEKIREHYGITVPSCSARIITEKHAEKMEDEKAPVSADTEADGEEYMIAETDRSMISIVDTDGEGSDRRKNRRYRWKEARLTLCHPKGSVTPVFGCTLGSPDEAGDRMSGCAIRSGMGQKTKVHCIGDGAPRIAEQTDRVFGGQGSFLIGFYHLRAYLSDASEVCPRSDFFSRQKQLAKEGRMAEVLRRMKPYTEPVSAADKDASVRRCIFFQHNSSKIGIKQPGNSFVSGKV